MQPLTSAFIDQLRFNDAGLIPAIAQDWLDGAVLMVAWMNRHSIDLTLSSGEVHYWSRSRKELWHKGATSGHTQKVRSIRYDCDADVILVSIEQTGDVACHTGARSCFYEDSDQRAPGGADALPPPADACTELMRSAKGEAAIKTGAEGVYVGILPGKKLGIALKIEDGATRASEAVLAALLVRVGVLDAADPMVQKRLVGPITNRRDFVTGEMRVTL